MIKRLWNRIKSNNFYSSVLKVATGTAIGQVVGVLCLPILTRLFTPEDFGALGLFTTILLISSSVGSLKLELAIPLMRSSVGVVYMEMTAMVISLILFIISIPLCFLLYFIEPRFQDIAFLLPFSFLILAVFNILLSANIRKKDFNVISKVKAYQAILGVATQIGLGLLKIGSIGLIAGFVVGQGAGLKTLARSKWRLSLFKYLSVQRSLLLIKEYSHFIKYTFPGTLLNTFTVQVPILIISFFYSLEELGYFVLAQKILGVPLNFLGKSVAGVYTAELADMIRSNSKNIMSFFQGIVKRQIVLSFGLVALITLAVISFSEFIFGSDWALVGTILLIFALPYVFRVAAISTGDTLSIVRQNKLHFVREIFRIMLFAIVFILIHVFALKFVYGLILLSAASFFGYLLYLAFSLRGLKTVIE